MNALVESGRTAEKVSSSKLLRERLQFAVGINTSESYKTVTVVYDYATSKKKRAAHIMDLVINSIQAYLVAHPECTPKEAAKIARDRLRSEIAE